MITNPLPKAKTERLIVKVIDDEMLVYDHGRATCLNEFAARVWRECDGETSVADIADASGRGRTRRMAGAASTTQIEAARGGNCPSA